VETIDPFQDERRAIEYLVHTMKYRALSHPERSLLEAARARIATRNGTVRPRPARTGTRLFALAAAAVALALSLAYICRSGPW
jgi:hypothetical protein